MIFTSSFFLEAGVASAYLLLKLFLVFSIAKLIRLKWAFDQISSLIAGWLVIQALQSGVILSLSAIGLLQQPYFLVFSLLMASFIYWQTRSLRFDSGYVEKSWQNLLPLIAIVFVLFSMWLRSLFFYDYTWDAQVYGLPRLAFWLNYRSVFVHMPTLQLNLFVNEWNAELNSLAYALASGAYLGFGFGNLEVLLVLFVTIAWVALLLGAPVFWALCLAAVLGSAPAMLGLASTVKGDLLACMAFMMAFGWLLYIKRGGASPQMAFGMLVLSAALAVGSKISVVLPVLAILSLTISLMGGAGIRNFWRLSDLTKLGFGVGLLVFSSRFWINWVIYMNPLKRVDGEKALFSLQHMIANLELAGNRMFGVWEEIHGKGPMWALAGSMGGTAWFIVSLALIGVIWRYNQATPQDSNTSSNLPDEKNNFSTNRHFTLSGNDVNIKWLSLVGTAILVTTIIPMTLTEAHPWTFRYFAPGIITLLLSIGAISLRNNTLSKRGWVAISAALVVMMNLAITSRPGEILPTPNLQALAIEIGQANMSLKRISLLYKGLYQNAGVEALNLDSDMPLNILIFQSANTSMINFFGSQGQNKIQTAIDIKELIAFSEQRGYDVVAILQEMDRRDQSLPLILEQKGYWIAVNNADYLIALPKSRVQLTPLIDFKAIQWTPWSSVEGVKLSIHDGMPEIESPYPVDTGFISQEFHINGPTLIRASFEGEIVGSETHAAHLSLHSKQPIITLPAGRYTASQSFQGIVPELGKDTLQRLSFGLGGWAVGSGRLRLTKLELFQLHIVDDKIESPTHDQK